MNPYYPRHWGIGFGKGGAGMRRPLSQEYCLNYTVIYRKIEKYDKIAKKRIFIVDYYLPPLPGLKFRLAGARNPASKLRFNALFEITRKYTPSLGTKIPRRGGAGAGD